MEIDECIFCDSIDGLPRKPFTNIANFLSLRQNVMIINANFQRESANNLRIYEYVIYYIFIYLYGCGI